MKIKAIIEKWNENTVSSIHFNHLKYIRTFSIEEFKTFFNIEKVRVMQHPSGVLYFWAHPLEEIGLTYGRFMENPVISVVCDYFGRCFYLLHHKDVFESSIHINTIAKQRQLNRSNSAKTYLGQTTSEYNRYVEDSIMDAFEGDSDSIWNIE